jgi:3-dehydroquinate synthase
MLIYNQKLPYFAVLNVKLFMSISMQSIEANGYSVIFNEEGYEVLNNQISKNNYSNIFIIVDSVTNAVCLPKLLPYIATELTIEIIEFEDGEVNKNIETCVQIWTVLTELGADRKSLILNLGGGVVTDLGGFVASTFKRGIDFVNIPTTLLSMVDASVGGKTGVDLGNLKNQIGVINTPKLVLIDTSYLETLSQIEMRSGLAEILKHGLIYDKAYWEQFLDLSKLDYADFDQIIYDSIKIKNEIVMQDPNEKGIRKALNFGHTLGHAIESYFLENENKKTLLHGEAIAIGMILESYISLRKNFISANEYLEIKTTINSIYESVVFEESDMNPILELLIHDKKNEYGTIKFVLLNGIGKFITDQEIKNELIMDAFLDYKS